MAKLNSNQDDIPEKVITLKVGSKDSQTITDIFNYYFKSIIRTGSLICSRF